MMIMILLPRFIVTLASLAAAVHGAALPRSSDSNSSAQVNPTWAQLAISANPGERYLYRTRSKEPFLWIGDTNWELFHRLNKTDVDLYLADRAARGFNVVQAVLLSKYNVTTLPNFYGDLAIDNEDVTAPNERYFRFVDWVVDRAVEYGILIVFHPVWGRYVNYGWYGELAGPLLFNESNAYVFGKFLGDRYPGIPKILGGDTNGFWADNVPQARAAWRANNSLDPLDLLGPLTDTRMVWSEMMRGFKEAEVVHGWEAFVSFQPTSPWLSLPGQPLPYGHNYINGSLGTLSMDAVQSGHENPDPDGIDAGFWALTPWDSTKNYENILDMRREFSGPVMDVENHYEEAHDSFDPEKPKWSAAEVRHGLWAPVLSGACGVTYGSLPVQQSYARKDEVATPEHWIEPQLGLSENASWREGLHLPGAKQAGLLLKPFEHLTKEEFNGMNPDRSFISSPEGSEEVLKFERNRYIAGLVTKGHYWVYAGYGDGFVLDLDALSESWGLPGTRVRAHWFDPRNASRMVIETRDGFVAQGKKLFKAPSSGSVEYDWLLVIGAIKDCSM